MPLFIKLETAKMLMFGGGIANFDKEHWKEVLNEFVKWTIN